MNDKKKPIHEIRLGNIKSTIWANESEYGERFNAVTKRIYRLPEEKRDDKKDTGWRETDSIGRDDLLLFMKVADLAHTFMFEQTASKEQAAYAVNTSGARNRPAFIARWLQEQRRGTRFVLRYFRAFELA